MCGSGIIRRCSTCLVCILSGCAENPSELRGTVDLHMIEQVRKSIAAGHKDFTINSSNGGLVFVAQVVAGQIKAANGTLTVNGRCWSACSLMAVSLNARQTGEADVQSHASFIPSTGAQTDDAANILAQHGYSRDLAAGPNLKRLDGTMAAPADAWANRDPFH